MSEEISIVIPAFNEEDNVKMVYSQVKSTLKKLGIKHEIIFVNDGSTDNTKTELLKIRERDSSVKIIEFRKNFGQSLAMQAGFDASRNKLVCYIDADSQINFSELPLFIKEIKNGADCVVGWRWDRKGSLQKRVLSRIASELRRIFLGGGIHDYGCPFKLMTRECVRELDLYGELHRYIPPMLSWKGFIVKEVKITHNERLFGKTKYGLKRVYKGFLDMLIIWFWQKYSNRPMHLFGGIGLIALIISSLFGTYLFYLKLFTSASLSNSSLPLLTVIIFLSGMILFCFGVTSDILVRIQRQGAKKKSYLVRRIY